MFHDAAKIHKIVFAYCRVSWFSRVNEIRLRQGKKEGEERGGGRVERLNGKTTYRLQERKYATPQRIQKDI